MSQSREPSPVHPPLYLCSCGERLYQFPHGLETDDGTVVYLSCANCTRDWTRSEIGEEFGDLAALGWGSDDDISVEQAAARAVQVGDHDG